MPMIHTIGSMVPNIPSNMMGVPPNFPLAFPPLLFSPPQPQVLLGPNGTSTLLIQNQMAALLVDKRVPPYELGVIRQVRLINNISYLILLRRGIWDLRKSLQSITKCLKYNRTILR